MYEVNVDQVGSEPLNETKSDNWLSNTVDDEEFDDQFEDDLEDYRYDDQVQWPEDFSINEEHDIDLPRWSIYDAVSDYFNS